MSGKPQRLSKVARECNVGIATIADFLKSKGFEVEARPNTKITPEMYELLVEQYSLDKAAKQKSQELRQNRVERKVVAIDEEVPEKVEEEKTPEPEPPVVKVKIEEPPKVSVEEEVEKPAGPKIVGKIDIDKPKPVKETAKEPVAEEPVKETSEEKTAEEKEEKQEVEHLETKVETLSGPTVVGKIDLPEPKKKPVASSSDAADSKKKRKRIRKGKSEVDVQRESKRSDKRKSKKRVVKPQLTEEEIKKEVRETLARLSGSKKSKSSKHKRTKREAISERMEEEMAQMEAEKKILKVTEFITVNELASMMDVPATDIITACFALGMVVTINQRLDAETLSIVAEEFGFQVTFVDAEIEEVEEEEVDNEEDLVPRPPIITVMGHVDHGKTSLLDYIRSTNVIAGEAGGITQHIGAYMVELDNGQKLTFLDTPGHEAFTAMRARGAKVTDIAIIVIAADDSVMPQTVEAINHAQAAGVPMVFAFNKIDKPGVNTDKIKEELANMNILVEDWGGKYQSQEISAKTGQGIDELMEKVLLEAELLELKANPNKLASGTVLESSLDKGRGYVATLLVQNGTLRVGDIIVAGPHYAKVKVMFDERDNKVAEAGPSHPVTLLGFNGAPNAGDAFREYKSEREAKQVATKREQLIREQGLRTQKHITLDEIGRRLSLGDFHELNIIVKGDVDGSIEALSDSLMKLSRENIQVNIIHKSVGQISESDVLLASASDAIIIGFQVRPSANARKLAEKEQVDIRLYSVIYDAIEEVKAAMEGMLKPKVEEKIVCNVEVRETFKISKVGMVAGCYVIDGKITRNTKIRLIRDGIVIYTGKLGSLKRFKDDVKEVSAGYECGLNIENFNDIKVGDVIEGYEEVEVAQKLT